MLVVVAGDSFLGGRAGAEVVETEFEGTVALVGFTEVDGDRLVVVVVDGEVIGSFLAGRAGAAVVEGEEVDFCDEFEVLVLAAVVVV